jgi:hypothetical protein
MEKCIMQIFEHEGLTIPVNCITAVQVKGTIVEVFTAFIGHRLSFYDESDADDVYYEIRKLLIDL